MPILRWAVFRSDVSSNVNQWKNTSADIEVRAGDTFNYSQETELRASDGPSVELDCHLLSAGEERKVVSDPGRRSYSVSGQEVHHGRQGRWFGNGIEERDMERRILQRRVATRRYRGCARKGVYRRSAVAIHFLYGAGGERRREHGVHCPALLTGSANDPREAQVSFDFLHADDCSGTGHARNRPGSGSPE